MTYHRVAVSKVGLVRHLEEHPLVVAAVDLAGVAWLVEAVPEILWIGGQIHAHSPDGRRPHQAALVVSLTQERVLQNGGRGIAGLPPPEETVPSPAFESL